jgi:hypothetical protein
MNLFESTFEKHKKLMLEHLGALHEEKFDKNPVAIAVLGAPASGKTFLVNKLKTLAQAKLDRFTGALSKGTDLTVDKLRAAFQSEDPRTQLKGFYYTCAWLRSLKEKEPNVYSKWYEDIKKTWKKMDDASDKLDTSVDGNDNLTINGKSDPESIVAILDQIEDSEIQKIFQTLDKYGDYKRAVRWVQDVKQREGRQHGDDLIFDEAGDEPEKIVSKWSKNYVWRLRIPFEENNNSRNYISKMLKYEKLLQAENSISNKHEFVSACIQTILKKVPYGIYNITNTGYITTDMLVHKLKNTIARDKIFTLIDENYWGFKIYVYPIFPTIIRQIEFQNNYILRKM